MKQSTVRFFAAFAAVVIVACSTESPVQPEGSPLAGLSKIEDVDTANVNHSPTGGGPGYFHGTVVGPWNFQAGVDSVSAAPRLSGVVVTIYQRKATPTDTVAIGDAKGSVTTGADGKFTLPTLPAGEYIVTFVPPADAGYHGAYAFGPLWENSSEYPWWVVLAKKK
jgi:hypothetical protein